MCKYYDKLLNEYLKNLDWRVKENSNMAYSFQGLNNHISSSVIAQYWLKEVYPQDVAEAHIKGDYHIHDLGSYAGYCCGWDLSDFLKNGFVSVSGKIGSSPPKHFRTALGQIVNFMFSVSGEVAGAVAFSNFDTYLAPYVRKDGLSYSEVKQSMQEFIFNMNISTRVGFQSPFSNITMDLQCPRHLKDYPPMIGGLQDWKIDAYGNIQDKEDTEELSELRQATLADFQEEMDMINRAFCEVMMEGDADGRLFSFPIPTYNLTKEFDWDNKNLDNLWKMTSKYGIPYFSNYINSDMSPEDGLSMCCRLRIDLSDLKKRGGGLFGSNPLTGSIGVNTINAARLGYTSTSKEEFMTGVYRLMSLAREQLMIKREVLEKSMEGGLYPYSKFYLRNVKKSRGTYWANHFNTIGILGMNEACLNLLGVSIADTVGKKFAEEVLTDMNSKLEEFQKEDGYLYNLEATPGEGTTYRFAKRDIKDFPDIQQAGTEEAPYYTNSTHLPVDYTDDVFEALQHQDSLQQLYSGGTVSHLFLGENINDFNICKELVRKVAENFHLPYFSITPTFSICPTHGYVAGTHTECPHPSHEESEDE